MATNRDLATIEERRLEGLRLLKRKVSQSDVARELGVTRQTVHIWANRLAQVNGAVGKLKAQRLGRPKRLDERQCERFGAILRQGALSAGFPTELWTVKRMRVVIEREFGVAYSNNGCWHLLRSLGFTPQKPEKRATQRSSHCDVEAQDLAGAKKSPGSREEPSSS